MESEEMITIYGRKTSSNVQTVMWAIAELDIEHERLDWGGSFGGNDDPKYLKLNPNGLVPTMVDGDLAMFEANAIVRYLAAQHGKGSGFWKEDARQRAHDDMWMEWAKTTVYPVLIAGLFMNIVRVSKKERDASLIAGLEKKLDGVMAIADRQLSERSFMAGDTLSLGDIGFGTLLFRYFDMEINRSDFPAVRAYYERLADRPPYREHVMVDYSSLRVE